MKFLPPLIVMLVALALVVFAPKFLFGFVWIMFHLCHKH